jgi:sulfur carrier protein ThiS
MMQVTVRLYGTLGKRVPGYVHSEGIVVKIPDNGKVKDLLSALKLPESQRVAVALDGRILAQDDLLRDGARVNVMQSLQGG